MGRPEARQGKESRLPRGSQHPQACLPRLEAPQRLPAPPGVLNPSIEFDLCWQPDRSPTSYPLPLDNSLQTWYSRDIVRETTSQTNSTYTTKEAQTMKLTRSLKTAVAVATERSGAIVEQMELMKQNLELAKLEAEGLIDMELFNLFRQADQIMDKEIYRDRD